MKLTIVSVSKVEEINARTYIIPKKNIGINEKDIQKEFHTIKLQKKSYFSVTLSVYYSL